MLSQWETLLGNLTVGLDLVIAVVLEGLVGGGIDRVFYVYAEALVLCKVGV